MWKADPDCRSCSRKSPVFFLFIKICHEKPTVNSIVITPSSPLKHPIKSYEKIPINSLIRVQGTKPPFAPVFLHISWEILHPRSTKSHGKTPWKKKHEIPHPDAQKKLIQSPWPSYCKAPGPGQKIRIMRFSFLALCFIRHLQIYRG